jgi:hypothetical protein
MLRRLFTSVSLLFTSKYLSAASYADSNLAKNNRTRNGCQAHRQKRRMHNR